jgi:hypothetical protein
MHPSPNSSEKIKHTLAKSLSNKFNQSNTYNNGYHPGEIVTLTATPDSGKTFAGWNCSAHCGTNSFTSSLTIDVVLDNDTIDKPASFN